MKAKEAKVQWNMKIDKRLLTACDRLVDGIRFRSRAHVAEVAIMEFLDRQKGQNGKGR